MIGFHCDQSIVSVPRYIPCLSSEQKKCVKSHFLCVNPACKWSWDVGTHGRQGSKDERWQCLYFSLPGHVYENDNFDFMLYNCDTLPICMHTNNPRLRLAPTVTCRLIHMLVSAASSHRLRLTLHPLNKRTASWAATARLALTYILPL